MYAMTPLVCNIGEERLRERIAQCDGRQLAERCALLNAALTETLWTRSVADAQVRLIDLVGNDPCRDQVVGELVRQPGTVLADPMALETLGAYALAVGGGRDSIDRFLETLMALSFETLREPGTEHIRSDPTGMHSALNATMTFGSDRHLNARWRLRAFVEWSRTGTARHHAHVDIDAALVDVFGTNYEELITAIEVLHTLGDFDVMQQRGSASFAEADVAGWDGPGHVRRLLQRSSLTRADFAEEILNVPLPDLRNGLVRTLLTTPVVAIGGSRYLLPSGRLADNLASLGWLYGIADALRQRDLRLSGRLWSFFGYFYEDYVARILERVAAVSVSQVWREHDLDGVHTADVIVRHGNEVQIYEVVSSRPNVELLNQPNNEELVTAELERLILAKIDQLADNVRRYLNGDFSVFGVDARNEDVVYPILVQYKSFLRTDDFHNEIQRRFFERLGQAPPNVREVELIDAEVLEGLEEHLSADRTLGMLIEEKSSDSRSRSAIFKNFIAFRHPELPLRFAPPIREANQRWQAEISQRVSEWRAF
jgi:hypothetical protein